MGKFPPAADKRERQQGLNSTRESMGLDIGAMDGEPLSTAVSLLFCLSRAIDSIEASAASLERRVLGSAAAIKPVPPSVPVGAHSGMGLLDILRTLGVRAEECASVLISVREHLGQMGGDD